MLGVVLVNQTRILEHLEILMQGKEDTSILIVESHEAHDQIYLNPEGASGPSFSAISSPEASKGPSLSEIERLSFQDAGHEMIKLGIKRTKKCNSTKGRIDALKLHFNL